MTKSDGIDCDNINKEFGCLFRIDKNGVRFFLKSPKQTKWQKRITEILVEGFGDHTECDDSCGNKAEVPKALQAITKATAELVVGEDVQHKHPTRVYDRGCQDRDLINGFKREQRKELGLE